MNYDGDRYRSQLVSYLVGVGQPSAGARLPQIHLPLAASGQDSTVPLFPHDRPVVDSTRNHVVALDRE